MEATRPTPESRPSRHSESVSARLFKINLKILAMAFVATVIVVTATVSASLRNSIIEAHQLKAETLAQYLSPALVFDDRKAVRGFLDSLSESTSVLSATVTSSSATGPYETYQQLGRARLKDRPWFNMSPQPFRINRPISYRGQRLGHLDMLVSMNAVVKESLAITGTVSISLILVITLVLMGLGRLNRSISEPLESLSGLMRRVSDSGNYGERASSSDVAEVNQLSAGFNNLMEQIAEREARITRMANFDSLTGLRNRRGFMMQLELELEVARRNGNGLLLLYIDVDGFKGVNDSLGHDIGDSVLIEVARRISGVLRITDTVARLDKVDHNELTAARLGGDEFTALLPHVKVTEDGYSAADRICVSLRQPYEIDVHSIRVSSSIGVAIYPRDGKTANALIQHADSAMYHAKESGRDQVRYYDDQLTKVAQRRLYLTSRLRNAIDAPPGTDEFELEYQPIVNARDGVIEGVEALARWNLGGGNYVSPTEFIPIAEATGLIVPLGQWILNRACSQVAMLLEHFGGELRLSVNVSPAQVHERNFCETVRKALAASRLAPHCLALEITEAVLIKGAERAAMHLDEVAALGVKIALDDFGTGYSSMSYLKSLPISSLKIDRVFVDGLPDDKGDLAIVRAILAMCDALDMRVTAEGVANDAQRRLLADLGCHALQGFYYSQSVPIQKIPALCSEYRKRKLIS